jgi:hypothetical protein
MPCVNTPVATSSWRFAVDEPVCDANHHFTNHISKRHPEQVVRRGDGGSNAETQMALGQAGSKNLPTRQTS